MPHKRPRDIASSHSELPLDWFNMAVAGILPEPTSNPQRTTVPLPHAERLPMGTSHPPIPRRAPHPATYSAGCFPRKRIRDIRENSLSMCMAQTIILNERQVDMLERIQLIKEAFKSNAVLSGVKLFMEAFDEL